MKKSRIGKLPVLIPKDVSVELKHGKLLVKGPKGNLEKEFDRAANILIENEKITVAPANNSKFAYAFYGTVRSIINSMVLGVQNPFEKKLKIEGVGFKAILNGKTLKLNLGYSHDIAYDIPEGIIIEVPEPTKILVKGADKQLVGQVAADIKHYYPAEPYKGKGVAIEGQFVRRKEGKKAA